MYYKYIDISHFNDFVEIVMRMFSNFSQFAIVNLKMTHFGLLGLREVKMSQDNAWNSKIRFENCIFKLNS